MGLCEGDKLIEGLIGGLTEDSDNWNLGLEEQYQGRSEELETKRKKKQREIETFLVSSPPVAQDCLCSIESRQRDVSMQSKSLGGHVFGEPLGNALRLHDDL